MDLFSTNTMLGIVEDLKVPGNSLLQTFFPRVITEESEEIHFDVDDARRRVAPFVSPLLPGKVVQGRGQVAKTFTPAYVKDKRVFDATRPLKRAMGETVGGGALTPAERVQLLLAQELQDQLNMLRRRLELMALETLSTGKVTVSGDGYPTTVVNFGRDSSLSPSALSGTSRWGQSAQAPLTNLRTWATAAQKKSGVYPRRVILDPDTLEAFLSDTAVKAELDQRYVTNASMAPDQSDQEGLAYIGRVRGFEIYTYSGWYVDPADDTEKTLLASGRVILTSTLVEGIQAFGAIKDHDSLAAVPYFPKSWTEQDPSVRFLLLQSAPLTVPLRPNASVGVNVL